MRGSGLLRGARNMTTTISFETSETALATVSDDMFGGNFLIDRDRIGEGTYDEAIQDLGLTNLRYPGGSVTEWFFDINDPDKTIGWDPDRQDWRELLPLSEFIADAASMNVGVTIVIPTGNLLGEGALGTRQPLETAYEDVKTFVYDLISGAYGGAEIAALEIGNEYWLSGEMNHVEYAAIASVIAEAAQAAIDEYKAESNPPDDWQEPEIAVQRGQFGMYSPDSGWVQNNYLIENLTDEAAEAIDAVLTHYYVGGAYEDLGTKSYHFDYLDDWNDDPRFGDLKYYATEWNVGGSSTSEAGMMGASAMLWVFSEMVLEGVDAAFVWPVQQNVNITLANDEGEDALTIWGETFRLLSESTPDKDLTARHDFGNGHVYVYEDAGQSVVFIASRSDTAASVELDLVSLGLDGYAFTYTHLGTNGAFDDYDALPVLTIEASYTDAGSSAFFDIGAYGVIRIVFDKSRTIQGSAAGTDGNDILTGSAENDALEGFDGDDTLNGGAGEDFLLGGAGNDCIDGGDQADIINAGDGDDEVYGGNGTDEVDLGAGNDVFWDNLQGGIWGMDTVRGGAGNDVINGGAGDDTFFGDEGNDVIDGSGGNDDIAGGDGIDLISGGTGDDKISGNAGADKLYGDSGNDTISGGLDNDRIYSGTGDDIVEGNEGVDQVWDDGGADVVWLGDGNDVFTDAASDGNASDTVYGGDGKDRIIATDGDDLLYGEADSDRIWGGNGNDTLSGDLGDDRLYGEADDDLIDGGDGRDYLYGGDGNDVLIGGADTDRLYGENGHDEIQGGEGNDRLYGGSGDDVMSGGAGKDKLYGESGDDNLDGGDGRDHLYGGDGQDVLTGGAESDRLYGESGNDRLEGGAGSDYLYGGDGDDILIGGDDGGWMSGGDGADVFVFDDSDGTQTVYDFEDGDLISLSGVSGFGDLDITESTTGKTKIAFEDTVIVLVSPTTEIDASDFLFA